MSPSRSSSKRHLQLVRVVRNSSNSKLSLMLILIIMIVASCSRMVYGEYSCYTGTIQSDKDGRVPLSSLQSLQLQVCPSSITTTPVSTKATTQSTLSTTTAKQTTKPTTPVGIMTTKNQIILTTTNQTVTQNVTTNATTTNATIPETNSTVTVAVVTVRTTAAQPIAPTTPTKPASTPQPTTPTKPSSTVLPAPLTTNHTNINGSGPGRRRRADSPPAALCQVTVSFGGDRLTLNTKWTADFSCYDADTPCTDDKTNCCSEDGCNTFEFFQQNKQDIKFSTVKSCYFGNTDPVQKQCDYPEANLCVTETQVGGATTYDCGSTEFIYQYCTDPGMNYPQAACFNKTRKGVNFTVCCCDEDDCNVAQSTEPNETKKSNHAGVIAGVLCAFVGGLILGILMVRYCTRGRGGNARAGELLSFDSFNYRRMAADQIGGDNEMS